MIVSPDKKMRYLQKNGDRWGLGKGTYIKLMDTFERILVSQPTVP